MTMEANERKAGERVPGDVEALGSIPGSAEGTRTERARQGPKLSPLAASDSA